jgi:hypothetical protein
MSITFDTILAPGTKVRVKRQIGTVVGCETVRAAGNSVGFISVHEIQFTHFLARTQGRFAPLKARYEVTEMPYPIRHKVSYSFIEVLPD